MRMVHGTLLSRSVNYWLADWTMLHNRHRLVHFLTARADAVSNNG